MKYFLTSLLTMIFCGNVLCANNLSSGELEQKKNQLIYLKKQLVELQKQISSLERDIRRSGSQLPPVSDSSAKSDAPLWTAGNSEDDGSSAKSDAPLWTAGNSEDDDGNDLIGGNDDDNGQDDDGDPSHIQKDKIDEETRKKIDALKEDIQQLQNQMRKYSNNLPNDMDLNTFFCFKECVFPLSVSCRVQMSHLREKSITAGTYYVSCPTTCHYPLHVPREAPPRNVHHGCVHYDKNRFYLVTYICKSHKREWYFQKVMRYRRLYEKYYYLYSYKREIDQINDLIADKRLQIRKLLNQAEQKQKTENAVSQKNHVILQVGVDDYVKFVLAENKLFVSANRSKVGTAPTLKRRFKWLYFSTPSCLVSQNSGADRTWNVNSNLNLDFITPRINNVKVLNCGRKNYQLIRKKSSKIKEPEEGNIIFYDRDSIVIRDRDPGAVGYKILIEFD